MKRNIVITGGAGFIGSNILKGLEDKGTHPHTLVMTAPPIPRTLALILYGDLDISVIDELPPGRKKVDTFVVGENLRQRVYTFIKKETGLPPLKYRDRLLSKQSEGEG